MRVEILIAATILGTVLRHSAQTLYPSAYAIVAQAVDTILVYVFLRFASAPSKKLWPSLIFPVLFLSPGHSMFDGTIRSWTQLSEFGAVYSPTGNQVFTAIVLPIWINTGFLFCVFRGLKFADSPSRPAALTARAIFDYVVELSTIGCMIMGIPVWLILRFSGQSGVPSILIFLVFGMAVALSIKALFSYCQWLETEPTTLRICLLFLTALTLSSGVASIVNPEYWNYPPFILLLSFIAPLTMAIISAFQMTKIFPPGAPDPLQATAAE